MHEICIPVDICTWNISLFWDVEICTNTKHDRRYVQIFFLFLNKLKTLEFLKLKQKHALFSERNVYTFNKKCTLYQCLNNWYNINSTFNFLYGGQSREEVERWTPPLKINRFINTYMYMDRNLELSFGNITLVYIWHYPCFKR